MPVEVPDTPDRISLASFSFVDAVTRLTGRIGPWFQFLGWPSSSGNAKGEPSQNSDERKRTAVELHDTLLQGFLSASLLLDQAVEEIPSNSSFKPSVSRALRLIHQ